MADDTVTLTSGEVLAMLDQALADLRERIAAEVEAEASRSSYRDQSEVTEAYLDAARIVQGQS